MSDVDLIGATITVRDPKNKRDRVVAMSTRVHEILTGRRQEWEAEHQAGRVDVRVYGSKADICKPVKKVMKAAHIDQERRDFLHPVHSLRDTGITNMVNAGAPLAVVQEIAGHASVEMTRRYADVQPESVRAAIKTVFG
mgnify:CR=1 FL=1